MNYSEEEKEVVNMIKTGLEVSVEGQIIEQIHISRKEAKALLNLIQKQEKIIDKMAEQLTTPVHSKEWIIEFYKKEVEKE